MICLLSSNRSLASIVFNEALSIFKINHESAERLQSTVPKNYKSRIGDVRVGPVDMRIPSEVPWSGLGSTGSTRPPLI